MGLPSLFCQGFCLCLVSLTVGIGIGMLGPSLPDINCLLHVGLGASSYLILMFGIGSAVSQLYVAKLIEKVPVYLLLCICETIFGVCYVSLPFSSSLLMAGAIVCVYGMVGGQSLILLFYKFSLLWPGQVRFNHLILGVSSLGSVLGPLLLGPFLSDGQITLSYRKDTDAQLFVQNNPSNQKSLGQFALSQNETRVNLWNMTFERWMNLSAQLDSNNTTGTCHDFFTMMYIPYLVFGLFSLLVSFTMLYFLFKERKSEIPVTYDNLDQAKFSCTRTKSEYVYIFVMCLYFTQGQGVPTGFSFLLPTFGIESSLNLSLSKMSFMTSMFWFLFMVGRLIPSFLPGNIKQIHIIITCYCGLALGNIVLVFCLYGESLLWFATVLFGIFSGPVFASGMNWSGTVVQLTPKVIASYMFFVGLGFALVIVGGKLMSNLNVNAFRYFFPGFYAYNLLTFTLALILSKHISSIKLASANQDLVKK